ncbi:MAG: heme-degrading domain-containing protein [Anaerolineales bacterium]|nr:heme-degrading domain-containing protein [Anaerolineales bacterium]MCB9144508.1 heme-degrading domain-containing protein [Anaerolineales bacterium]
MEDFLKELLDEEEELQFAGFNEITAWELGRQMVEYAMSEKISITIDIRRGEHQIFHYSMPGTSLDNDEWIKRKVRLVNRFGHSSFYMGMLLRSKSKRIEESYLIPESEYAAHGGCFPILIKGTGMIGTITVSGLPQEEDHRIVVQSIREFLAKEK